MFHVVFHGDPVPVEVNRARQHVQPVADLGRDRRLHVQRQTGRDEIIPGGDARQLGGEQGRDAVSRGRRELPPRAPPVNAEPLQRLAHAPLVRVRRVPREQRGHDRGARRRGESVRPAAAQRLHLALEDEAEVLQPARDHQPIALAVAFKHHLGRAAAGVAAGGALGQLGAFDAGARHAEAIREIA